MMSEATQPNSEKKPLPVIARQIDKILCETQPTGKHVDMCLSRIDDMLGVIDSKPINQRHEDVLKLASAFLNPLVKTIYISISKKDDLQNYYDHLISLLINVLGLMEQQHFDYYFESFSNRQELSEFIKSLLFLFLSISTSDNNNPSHEDPAQNISQFNQNCEDATATYHSDEIISQNSIIAKSLANISNALRLSFRCQNFQHSIWIDYFKCSFSIANHKALQLEDMSILQRDRILSCFGDIRLLVIKDIRLSWDSISSSLESLQKLNNELIGALLQLSLLRNEKIRSTVVPMFLKMIQAEYAHSTDSSQDDSVYICDSAQSGSTITNQSRSDCSNCFSLRGKANSLGDQSLFRSQTIEPVNFELGFRTESFRSNQSINSLIYGKSFAESSNSCTSNKNSFQNFLKETVTHLHKFLEMGLGDINSRISFSVNGTSRNITSTVAAPVFYDSQFTYQVHLYESAINGLIQLMLDLRSVKDNILLQISCLLRLLDFFENVIDHKDLFVYYLYKLYYIHVKTNNLIEAGFVLLRHAKLLSWSDDVIDNHHSLACHVVRPQLIGSISLVNQRRLKEMLYLNVLDLFEQGQLWEAGLPLCRELYQQYGDHTFEYSKISQLLRKMSIFYESIVETYLRPEPTYFRISFYGKGFPLFLRNSTLLFRGAAYENLGDFQARIMVYFDGCKLVPFIGPPGPDISESDGCHIQISTCQPVMQMLDRFNGQQVDNRITNFYKANDVNKFMYMRKVKPPPIVSLIDKDDDGKLPLSKSDDEFANLWREKIILQTQHKLPGLSYFFPVTSVETIIVSPIENAIEDLVTTNTRLERLIQDHTTNVKGDVRSLGQQLAGMIDAAVNGGISRYEQAFFIDSNIADQTELVHKKKLKSLIAAQVPLLEKGLAIHSERVVDEMRPLHLHLEDSFRKLKAHILERYGNYSMVGLHCTGRRSRSSTLKLRANRTKSSFCPPTKSDSRDTTPSSSHTGGEINGFNSLSLKSSKSSNLNSSQTNLSQLRSSSLELRTVDHIGSPSSLKKSDITNDQRKTSTNSMDSGNTMNLSSGSLIGAKSKEGLHKYLKEKFKSRRANICAPRLSHNKFNREQASLSQFYGDVLDDDNCTMNSLSNNFVNLTPNSAYNDSDNELETADDDQLFIHQLWERSSSMDTLNTTTANNNNKNYIETNLPPITIGGMPNNSTVCSHESGTTNSHIVTNNNEIRMPPFPLRTSLMCQQRNDKPSPSIVPKDQSKSLSSANNSNSDSNKEEIQHSLHDVSYNNSDIVANGRYSDNCYSADSPIVKQQQFNVASQTNNKNKSSLSGADKPFDSNKTPPSLPPKPSRVT